MEIINSLRFRNKNDKAFAEKQIQKFAERYINWDIYEYIQVTNSSIFIKRKDGSGISSLDINSYNLELASTAKEMMMCISALNNAETLKKNKENE